MLRVFWQFLTATRFVMCRSVDLDFEKATTRSFRDCLKIPMKMGIIYLAEVPDSFQFPLQVLVAIDFFSVRDPSIEWAGNVYDKARSLIFVEHDDVWLIVGEFLIGLDAHIPQNLHFFVFNKHRWLMVIPLFTII